MQEAHGMVVIVFRNGYELHVEAEQFEVKKSDYTNDLLRIATKGCKNYEPIYIRLDDVVCIYKVLEE